MDLNELSRVLGDEIYRLRSGKVKPERTNAISRAATVVTRIATVQLQAIKVFGGNSAPQMFGIERQKALPKKKNGNGKS